MHNLRNIFGWSMSFRLLGCRIGTAPCLFVSLLMFLPCSSWRTLCFSLSNKHEQKVWQIDETRCIPSSEIKKTNIVFFKYNCSVFLVSSSSLSTWVESLWAPQKLAELQYLLPLQSCTLTTTQTTWTTILLWFVFPLQWH